MFSLQRNQFALLSIFAGLILLLAGAASVQASISTSRSYNPAINPADFVTTIDNHYYPLKPGTVFIYDGTKGGKSQHDVVTVTHATRLILGVSTTVVRDQVSEEGKLTE